MKHTLLILLSLCAAASLQADVVLSDTGTVTKNGINLNNASDALLNGKITSAEFMAALAARTAVATAAVQSAQDDLNALRASITARLQADLSAFQTALKTAADPAQTAVLNAQIGLVNTYLQAASQTPDQLRAALLQADIAAKQAELAKLQSN